MGNQMGQSSIGGDDYDLRQFDDLIDMIDTKMNDLAEHPSELNNFQTTDGMQVEGKNVQKLNSYDKVKGYKEEV